MLERERYHQLSVDELSRLGAALPPGPSFVGGVHLVVWAHIDPRAEKIAVELVHYLGNLETQVGYAQRMGLLPARLGALQQPPYATDPRLQVFVKAMEGGRSHASIPMWGMLEDKISIALTTIWSSIKQNPQQGLDVLISEQLEPLADRLDVLLSR